MRPHHTFLLQKPLMQYLQEIHHLRIEDRLPSYMPPSILIQHYVYFRIALRRYAAESLESGMTLIDPSVSSCYLCRPMLYLFINQSSSFFNWLACFQKQSGPV